MAESDASQPDIPQRIGIYRITRLLGEGPRGPVYLGVAAGDDADAAAATDAAGVLEAVAVKTLDAGPSDGPGASAESPGDGDFVGRLRGVGRVSSSYVARTLDAGVADGRVYVVREYVEGRSLAEAVAADGPLAGEALERLAVGTLTALTAVHLAGFAHRGLTPANVIMTGETLKITDIEIGDPAGELGYRAPEQLNGLRYGPYADVFAWAATMVFAATGSAPFAHDADAVLHAEPEVGDLPEPLRQVVLAGLAKDVAGRPTTYTALLRLLGDANAPIPPSAATPPPANATPHQNAPAAPTAEPAEPQTPGAQPSGGQGGQGGGSSLIAPIVLPLDGVPLPPPPPGAPLPPPVGAPVPPPPGADLPLSPGAAAPPPGAPFPAPGAPLPPPQSPGSGLPPQGGPVPPAQGGAVAPPSGGLVPMGQGGVPGPPLEGVPVAGPPAGVPVEGGPDLPPVPRQQWGPPQGPEGAHQQWGPDGGQAPQQQWGPDGGQVPQQQWGPPGAQVPHQGVPAQAAQGHAAAAPARRPFPIGLAAGVTAVVLLSGLGLWGASTYSSRVQFEPAAAAAGSSASPAATGPTGQAAVPTAAPQGTQPQAEVTAPWATPTPDDTGVGPLVLDADTDPPSVPVLTSVPTPSALPTQPVVVPTRHPRPTRTVTRPTRKASPKATVTKTVKPTPSATPTPTKTTKRPTPTPTPTRTPTSRPTTQQPQPEPTPTKTTASAAPKKNPYTPTQVCGPGFYVQRQSSFTGGTTYQLYNSGTGENCVVTMKNGPDVGRRTPVRATLEVQGGGTRTDSGSYDYYAGPVKLPAKGKCVRYSGSAGSGSTSAAWGNCG
ncbi:serine/threonine protein kinase [Nonomuraea pusilla]|uniref:Serine/threonine protein kinase n=1 Tax=Nonomuraea pusilla TaxID=46177 RepID=A0A1H7V9K7_9ACTN|nr:serine/threonine-protein kinase [Nonomuraea pusilla]SEM05750.1 Serine/threonine protein kinase [Nonomuraea pusilla]